MFKPEVIAGDVETALLDGTPSTEFYRHDFRVVSAAFSWFREDGTIKSVYLTGEKDIADFLRKIAEQRIPLVVHNASFEIGVIICRFPWFPVELIKYDTMRLAQVADNGGKDAQRNDGPKTLDEELAEALGEKSEARSGLGLQSVVSRWLPSEYHNHKEPFYRYLREEHGVKKGKEGANLHLLPAAMLEEYNVKDTEVTLLLWRRFTEDFAAKGYDWRLDHTLYRSTAELVTRSQIRGVPVNRPKLAKFKVQLEQEMQRIADDFRRTFVGPIEALEQEYIERYVNAYKSEKGQANAWERAINDPSICGFNVGSTHHLADLFVRKLGISPRFLTAKGAPSFKSSFLSQWGEGGLMLKTRKTRLIELKQTEALLGLSEYDGRWHVSLKVAAAASGRLAGGSN